MSASKTANTTDEKPATGGATMEAIVVRENMLLVLPVVVRNAGAPRVDEPVGPGGRQG